MIGRFRPLEPGAEPAPWNVRGNTLSVPDMHSAKREPITCTLDALFDHESSQKEVYDAFAEPCVADFLRGINATIFAYGQTGAGKSYTMMGKGNDDDQAGIIPRLCQDLFQRISLDNNPDAQYSVEVIRYIGKVSPSHH